IERGIRPLPSPRPRREVLVMARGGWLRLYRQIGESPVFDSPQDLKVWIWCLISASHQKRRVSMASGRGFVEVEIEPGQFICGRKSAAKKLRMKGSTITDTMRRLQRDGNIVIKANSKFSLVTICNWASYQDSEN